MDCCVVIPARLGSSRFPGKPLARLGGRPLIAHVVARALEADVGPVAVATDDARIAHAAETAGASVVMTRSDQRSGTDRVAEAIARSMPTLRADGVVLNLQGDEPLIDRAALRAVVGCCGSPGIAMATAAAPLEPGEADSPHVVKVVLDAAGAGALFLPCPAAVEWRCEHARPAPPPRSLRLPTLDPVAAGQPARGRQ